MTASISRTKVGFIAVIVIAVIAALFYLEIQRASQETQASIRLRWYCESQTSLDDAFCREWASDPARMTGKEMACYRLSPDLDAPFYQCLRDEGILAP